MITVRYELTYALYKQAMRLHRRKFASVAVAYIILCWCVPTATLVSLFAWLFYSRRFDYELAGWAASLFEVFAVLSVTGVLSQVVVLKRGYRSSFPTNYSGNSMVIEVTDAGVTTSIPEMLSTHFSWNSVWKYAEDGQFVLLYTNKLRFVPVFLSNLEAPDAEQVRALVHRNVKAPVKS